jgi:hypothetical protein
MANYRVICAFNDILDNSFLYSIGDTYPRKGMYPAEGRIQELMSGDNRQGKPLIEPIAENVKNTENSAADVDVKPLKRKRGKKNDND